VADNPNEMIRVHIWVKGRVQGVAFRAHVEYNALQVDVLGWVRNVGWNIVETVAEGKRGNIEQFIEIVKQGPRAAHVDESRVEYETFTGEFTGFDVKHSV
jgi:acylphosphatase